MSDKIKHKNGILNRQPVPPKNREEARAYNPKQEPGSRQPLRETNRAGIAG